MREKEEEKEEAYKADLGSYRQPSESYKQKIGEEEAHLGQEGTYYCARERFYWPSLREEVFKLVERCPACSEFASPRKPERASQGTHGVGLLRHLPLRPERSSLDRG